MKESDRSLDEDVEPAWEAEVARRIVELESGEVVPIPWSAARNSLLTP